MTAKCFTKDLMKLVTGVHKLATQDRTVWRLTSSIDFIVTKELSAEFA